MFCLSNSIDYVIESLLETIVLRRYLRDLGVGIQDYTEPRAVDLFVQVP